MRDTQRETELIHARLRDIAQAVINDDQLFTIISSEAFESGSLSPRSRSPNKKQDVAPRTGSPFADATLSAVQAALNKRHLQVKTHRLSCIVDADQFYLFLP